MYLERGRAIFTQCTQYILEGKLSVHSGQNIVLRVNNLYTVCTSVSVGCSQSINSICCVFGRVRITGTQGAQSVSSNGGYNLYTVCTI